MALISAPTLINPEFMRITPMTSAVTSKSPFTFGQQVIRNSGDQWLLEITIPPLHRVYAEAWISFIMRLKGPVNTFMFGDRNAESPLGTISAATVTGSVGSDTATLTTATGDFAAGDYMQLGSGASSELYKVLEAGGNGDTVDVFPRLRTTHAGTSATVNNAQGVFRMMTGTTPYTVDASGRYSINIAAEEVI